MIQFIKKTLKIQFIRFLIVGGINTLFGYGVFSLCIFLNLHYSLAVLIATVLGVLFNFKTTGKFVFSNKSNILIFRFALVYLFVYISNVIGLSIFNAMQINNYIGGAILILPLALLSYFLNKKFVFNSKIKNEAER